MKKLNIFSLAIAPLIASLLFFSNAFATGISGSSSYNSACAGISQVDSSQSCGAGGSTITGIIKDVVTVLSLVLGGLAIIMIIISGIRFATSGGSSNAVSSAKKTLIYAIAGLALAALAQAIVHWVLGTSSSLANGGLVFTLHRLY